MCLVICEGKYDTLFLKYVIEENSILDTDRYLGSDRNKVRSQEDYMESFPYKEEDILLKSESGKSFQINLYKRLIFSIDQLFENYYLLLDLDTGSLQNAFENIKQKLEQLYSPNQNVEINKEIIDENDTFYYFIITGSISDREFKTPVLAFKSSLESEANIDRDEDSKEKKEKVRQLANNSEISDFIIENLVENL